MRRSLALFAVLAAGLSLLACGGAGPAPSQSIPTAHARGVQESAPSAAMAPAAPGAAAPAPVDVASAKGAGSSAAAPTAGKKAKDAGGEVQRSMVIYTGALRMVEAEDKIPQTIDKIIDAAEAAGGGMVSRRDDAVEIRVPSDKFRDTLTKLEGVGRVVARSVKAEDVSEEYHDLEVRLANLRTTQKRLQDFMARATNVNEALTVERELERVAQEIDRIEGRLSFLKTRASFSTISVQLTPKAKDAPIATPNGPASPKRVDLPVDWLSQLGVDPLLSLKK